MGFLDKAKQMAAQAQEKLETTTQGMQGGQDRRAADTWFKELGQWVYLERMGRDPRAAAEIDVRIEQLAQLEQQVGAFTAPLPTPGTGAPASEVPEAPAAPAAPAAAPSPTAEASSAPAAAAPAEVGSAPPAPAAPPTPAAPPPSTEGMASPPGTEGMASPPGG